jgi:mannose/cellobiose epimerase-like protein (N-acyl-D-glucosamine 2-epimerase family)
MPVSLIGEANRARYRLVSMPSFFGSPKASTQGGLFDSLDITNVENCANKKRLRVATRQIHVFSEAARLGVAEVAVAVSHGLDFLFSFARHPEGAFASHFNLASKQMSADRDTYDLAFVLFALLKLSPMASRDASIIERRK